MACTFQKNLHPTRNNPNLAESEPEQTACGRQLKKQKFMVFANRAKQAKNACFGLRLLILSSLAASLTQFVLVAPHVSKHTNMLEVLKNHGYPWWGLLVIWLVALSASFVWVNAEHPLRNNNLYFGLVCFAFLCSLLVPHVTHRYCLVTHPALALWLSCVLTPLLDRFFPWVEHILKTHTKSFKKFFCVPKRPSTGPLLATLAVFGVVFVQSYRRHIWFGSGGMDLGLFHQTEWLLSQGLSPHNTILGMHAFADHMDFVNVLAAPLQWIWPSAGALLLFQAAVVALGAGFLFDMARDKLGTEQAAWGLVVVYVVAVPMQQAVMFDFNLTTVGAGLLPVIVWCYERRAWVGFFLALFALALCKENLVLWGIGLCLALATGNNRNRRPALFGAAALLALFALEMGVLFPLFGEHGFRHFRYSALGTSMGEVMAHVLQDPLYALTLLFTPEQKIDGLLVPFSCVAFFCFLAPRYAIAFLPLVVERFWSDHANRWWDFHYGAGISVLVTLAAMQGLANAKQFVSRFGVHWMTRVPVLAVVLSCVLVGTLGHFGRGPLVVWRHPYYATPKDRENATAIVDWVTKMVPKQASVAAQNHLLPHLSNRKHIYQLTSQVHAEFVVLDFAQSAWPFERNFPKKLAQNLLEQNYGMVACQGTAVVLQKGAVNVSCKALE